jgi:quinolinate synthase
MEHIKLIEEINRLRNAKNAVILAHYYTVPEVQEIADFVGDSLALAQQAARTDADVVVFAGVFFMGETAKILTPKKKVLIPDPAAGCSLADSCKPTDFSKFLEQYPHHVVVSYVNTSIGVKALTDIVCTSSNAIDIIRSIPASQKIVFGPDRNLGNYLKRITGREMVIWDGACHVHEEFSVGKLAELKRRYPEAKVLAHPECKQQVLLLADYVGSTAALLKFSQQDDSQSYIVATESGILHQMQKSNPEKTFIPAPPLDSTCGCNDCAYMKLVTLEKIYQVLRDEQPEVVVDEEERKKAEKSILKMLELSK